MRTRRLLAAFTATCVLVLLPVLSPLSAQGGRKPAAPSRPAPRTADGKINFGSPPGEKGTWAGVDNRMLMPEKPEEVGLRDANTSLTPEPGAFPKPKFSEVPFQPWARGLYLFRTKNEFEPYTRCKPAGGSRMVATAYGTDFIYVPEQQRIYITQTGGPHSFRPIFLDGRPHPTDPDPSYYGHSVGHWEGDTLVIDTVGFNERSWIDHRGLPTTEQLHLTERITRPDFNTLRYEMTIDDPGAYTKPFTTGMFFRWSAGAEQFEFLCQDGNLAPILMIGAENKKLERTSRVAP
ncbi:MAG TPA: hypothetical protein VM818_03095 [Vicinamibacterales bacterium]|jgi:hypothetical protein|nr:hypothetical protein [Vicinamibacterales bacterium]